MDVTLDIPDDLAPALITEGQKSTRVAFEAFRERCLSEYQPALLGLPSRWDLHALFRE